MLTNFFFPLVKIRKNSCAMSVSSFRLLKYFENFYRNPPRSIVLPQVFNPRIKISDDTRQIYYKLRKINLKIPHA